MWDIPFLIPPNKLWLSFNGEYLFFFFWEYLEDKIEESQKLKSCELSESEGRELIEI